MRLLQSITILWIVDVCFPRVLYVSLEVLRPQWFLALSSCFHLLSLVYKLCIILFMLPVLWHVNPAVDFGLFPSSHLKHSKTFICRDDFNEGGNVQGCSSFHNNRKQPKLMSASCIFLTLVTFLVPPFKEHNFNFSNSIVIEQLRSPCPLLPNSVLYILASPRL